MRIKALATLLLAGLVAACAGTLPGSVEGRWILESGTHADGEVPTDVGTRPRLVLADGLISGQSHCNSFNGQFRANSSGRFQIVDGLAVTEMACVDNEAMNAERLLLEALEAVSSFRVEDGILTLEGDGHRLVFTADTEQGPSPSGPPGSPDDSTQSPATTVPEASGGADVSVTNRWFPPETYGEWELERGVVDGEEIPIAEGHPVTLSVSDLGFGGKVCNDYGFVPNREDPDAFPDIFSTMMLCTPDGVMRSEQAYLDALRRFESARLEDGKLVIEGDGMQMLFRPSGGG
ncbi:MAG TPA: META domain-containing protein [Acidimicrobiia bacterium]